MLQEVPAVQVAREPHRRWFADEYFDLCYDKPRLERAVIWSRDRGHEHFRVDAGDDTPMRNRTPILVSDGSFPKEQVIAQFIQAAAALAPPIRTFVLERLR